MISSVMTEQNSTNSPINESRCHFYISPSCSSHIDIVVNPCTSDNNRYDDAVKEEHRHNVTRFAEGFETKQSAAAVYNEQQCNTASLREQQCDETSFTKEIEPVPPINPQQVEQIPSYQNAVPVIVIGSSCFPEPKWCCCKLRTGIIWTAIFRVCASISAICFVSYFENDRTVRRFLNHYYLPEEYLTILGIYFQCFVTTAYLIILFGAIKRWRSALMFGIIVNIVIHTILCIGLIAYCYMHEANVIYFCGLVLETFFVVAHCEYGEYLKSTRRAEENGSESLKKLIFKETGF